MGAGEHAGGFDDIALFGGDLDQRLERSLAGHVPG